MIEKHVIDIYSAGCPCCDEAVALVLRVADATCDIRIHDMHQAAVAAQARSLGVRAVPAVAIDGELVICCIDQGLDETILRAAIRGPVD